MPVESALKVYIDFRSPAAYLAFKPTCLLIDRLGVITEWLPFQSPVKPVPEPAPNETRGETHRRVRAVARQQTHQLYADLQGIPLHFPAQPGRCDCAHAALLNLAPGKAQSYVASAFDAYWVQGADLNDPQIVAELGGGQIPGDYDIPAQLSLHQANAIEQDGVVDVPAYVVGGQLFIGREHLPWLEEVLVQLA